MHSFAPPEIPEETQNAIIERLVRAELSHRQNAKKGISEHDVVKTVNEVADKFGLPEYTRTRNDQVRFLRIQLMLPMDYLIAQEKTVEKKVGKKVVGYHQISRYMSPLEAIAVTLILVQQKMSNEEFQKTPTEFANYLYQKRLNRWQTFKDGQSNSEQTPDKTPKLRAAKRNAKIDEIHHKIHGNPNVNLVTFANESLNTLGVEQ